MEETNKLYVGGISWNLEWQDLKDTFKQYGDVAYVKIIKDRETNKSRGFWFVEFNSIEDAVVAKEAMNGSELDGRTLTVDFAQEKVEVENIESE